MQTKKAFGKGLRKLRKAKGLTQEDFSDISSRTYISQLERGQKSPTIEKIDAFAKTLKIHPLTLLSLTYVHAGGLRDPEALFRRVRSELEDVL
jgi:transcriptional regulator with XRE-family HTH domain